VDLVVPLVKTSLTIGDLVPDSLLSTGADGQVSLLYTSRLFDLRLDTILTAPDTNFRYTYVLPLPGPVSFQPGATFNTANDVTRFELDGLELRTLRIRSGLVSLAITSMINGPINGDFELPGATLNGDVFAIDQSVPAGTPASPTTLSSTRDLDGYAFDMRGPFFNDVNTLATHLSYRNAGATAVDVTDQDSLIALVSYQDIVPDYALGYFGTRDIHIDPSSTDLDLFENVSGMLDLDQVTARLKVTNGIGVDARADLLYIRSVNSNTGNTVDLMHPIITAPINLDRALDLGNGFQPAHNEHLLTEANSNIDLFLENLPNKIEYAVDITIDPLGDVSNGHDFFYYESTLAGDLELDIPLNIAASGLMLRTETNVDLPGGDEGSAVRNALLHLFAVNGFPFSAAITLEIIDDAGQVISTLPVEGQVASGLLGPDGLVQTPVNSTLNTSLTGEQADLLNAGRRLRITALFNTTSLPDHVRILDRYALDLQVTAEGNYIVNGE
jgi:hypothetical protein